MAGFRRLAPAAALMSACALQAPPRPSFDAALAEHLRAIEERDLDGYERTVSKDVPFVIILPDGTRIDSRDEALKLHTEWFSDTSWRMKFEEVQRTDLEDVVIILLKTSYRDQPDGPDRYAWLTLAFALEEGVWRVVYDQNTRLSASGG